MVSRGNDKNVVVVTCGCAGKGSNKSVAKTREADGDMNSPANNGNKQ